MNTVLRACIGIGLCLASADVAPVAAETVAVPVAAGTLAKFQRSNAGFALELYAKLGEKPGNAFFSPLSVTTAFGMAYAGARGETAAQMAAVLRFPKEDVNVHDLLGATISNLNALGRAKGCRIDVANRLWGQQGEDFLPEYLNVVNRCYAGGLERLDFKGATEASRLAINGWVETQTERRIKDLIPAGMLDPETKLVLTNAVYFKADWASPFNKKATEDAPFSVAPDRKETVSMMHRMGRWGFQQADGCKVLEVPYAGETLSMLVYLPDKADGLADVEKSLKPETIARAGSLPRREVDVFLPKFKMTLDYDLGGTLASMGMPLAFSDAADFSGITGGKDLLISKVVHKAFVAVDEEGTEAAAATGIIMRTTAMPVPTEPIVFRADHPFLFLIRQNDTGAVLFMGRVVSPTESATVVPSAPAATPKPVGRPRPPRIPPPEEAVGGR